MQYNNFCIEIPCNRKWLILLHAARTEGDAVVEVFVVRVLWLQTSSESAVFRRTTIWMWKWERMQTTAEFTIIWHSKLEWRLNWSMDYGSHGSVLPCLGLLLSPQTNWSSKLVFHQINFSSVFFLSTYISHKQSKKNNDKHCIQTLQNYQLISQLGYVLLTLIFNW